MLNEILANANKTLSDVTKIYHGKDNWCRCGCGGNYFKPGEAGFTRAVNAMMKESFRTDGEIEYGINEGYNYINIPVDEFKYRCAGECYCLYFD